MNTFMMTGQGDFRVANVVTSGTVELDQLMAALVFDAIGTGSKEELTSGNATFERFFASMHAFMITEPLGV